MTTDQQQSNKLLCYNVLIHYFGCNQYAACGVLANIQAESGYNPQNLQDTYNIKLEMSDSAYTDAVDNGRYKNFIHDSAGYGLAQWTWWKRKEGLLNLARECRCSVGNINIQLDYLKWELDTNYIGVKNLIMRAGSAGEAARIVMIKYEEPYDQSDKNQERRAAIAEDLYMELCSVNDKVYYTVRRGDTLWALSRRFGTTITGIVNANKLAYPTIRPEYIETGWILEIPIKK